MKRTIASERGFTVIQLRSWNLRQNMTADGNIHGRKGGGFMKRTVASERGFTFIEVLAVMMLLGILILVAMPQYFGTQSDALKAADVASLRAINSAIAIYQFKKNGACPGQSGQDTFATFLASTTLFPDGVPNDPRTGTTTPYSTSYDSTLCRVLTVSGTINHNTGTGH